MCVKLISLVPFLRKELFSSRVQRGSGRSIVQPVEMISSGNYQRRVRGLERIRGVSKFGISSLGCYVTVSEKGVPQPTEKDRHNQGDN